MTLYDEQRNEFVCIKKLKEIKKHAPEYRQKHLQSRLDVARKRKDEKTEKAIIHILKWEYDKKKFGRRRVIMGKQRGLPAAQITVPCKNGTGPVFF